MSSLTGAKDRHISKKTLGKYVKKTIFYKITKIKAYFLKVGLIYGEKV